jgi:hypothetical protein
MGEREHGLASRSRRVRPALLSISAFARSSHAAHLTDSFSIQVSAAEVAAPQKSD